MYDAYVISTSKYAANIILDKIKKKECQNILLIGINHIISRLVKDLSKISKIKLNVIGLNAKLLDEMDMSEDSVIIGDPKDENVLERVNIREIDFVFNSDEDPTNSILITKKIRDYNKRCKIYSRFFQDTVAEVLEHPPFNCKVISSSKYALKIMEKKEMLNF